MQFGGVFLFCTASAYFLSVAQTKALAAAPSDPPPVIELTLGLLIGLSATLMMSNGAVLLLCILFVFFAARLFNRFTAMVALAGIVAAVAFGATFTPHPGHTTFGYSLSHPAVFTEHFFVYVGSIFFPIGLHWAVTCGIVGLAVYATLIASLFFGRTRRDIPTLTLLAAMTFVLASGLLTASGRSSFGPEQAASNRYATPSALFWAGSDCPCCDCVASRLFQPMGAEAAVGHALAGHGDRFSRNVIRNGSEEVLSSNSGTRLRLRARKRRHAHVGR